MTHSGGLPHSVGDRGQRYEIRCTGWPHDEQSVIGWAETVHGILEMASRFVQAPGCKEVVLIDRRDLSWRVSIEVPDPELNGR